MAGKVNWMTVVDYIFKNKHMYKTLTDDDKIDSFYIINHKFGVKYPQISQFLNRRDMDKASAIDYWFLYLRTKETNVVPSWYWSKSPNEKEKLEKLSNPDRILVQRYSDIDNVDDLDFLFKHFGEDIKDELKKSKRFE